MRKRMIGILMISILLLSVLVVSFGYVNFDYLFKGDLKSISITNMNIDNPVAFIIEEDDKKSDLQKVFFNKITSSLGPTTAEGGNFIVVFIYEKSEIKFDLILNESSTTKSYIKYSNKNRDYSLSESDANYLRNFISLNNLD